MKKLLVTGISGFLGWHIAHCQQDDYTLLGVYNKTKPGLKNIDLFPLDLTDNELVKQFLAEHQPDAILHLAANSNPNNCEQNESSRIINVDATVNLAKWCNEQKIPFVFTSTDLVFDGKNAPYSESSKPNPIMVYGKQKLKAEQKTLNIYDDAIIARMPLMYGMPDNGLGFMNVWIRNLKEGEKVFCFTDEYRTTLSGNDAALGLFLLLKKREKGIYHLGGKESISRFDFAIKMARIFNFPENLITPSSQKDVQMPAKRPANVSFNSNKAFTLGFNPSSIDEELKKLAQ